MSSFLTETFFALANQWESIPFLFAFLLGIVGSLAPCQLTGNLGAMTIYGYRSLEKRVPWQLIAYFILGKIVVFTLLGSGVWFLGKEVEEQFSLLVPYLRKLIGPMLIVVGLFLSGWLTFKGTVTLGKLSDRFFTNTRKGSFLMGVSFTLAFCPTMFLLFFFTLMPIVVSTSYGPLLPVVFGLGTSLPLVLIIFLIWYFELGGLVMKRSRKIGNVVQKVAGVLLVLIGIVDTWTYWI
ncbi:sulfite exporter TauE/SafE family protein [Halobacillus fulvus]|nr:sulfite exporter TauE/SafE family protein [Halobacillus fulvus]